MIIVINRKVIRMKAGSKFHTTVWDVTVVYFLFIPIFIYKKEIQ